MIPGNMMVGIIGGPTEKKGSNMDRYRCILTLKSGRQFVFFVSEDEKLGMKSAYEDFLCGRDKCPCLEIGNNASYAMAEVAGMTFKIMLPDDAD